MVDYAPGHVFEILITPSGDVVYLVTKSVNWLPAKLATPYMIQIFHGDVFGELRLKKVLKSAIWWCSLFYEQKRKLVAGKASNPSQPPNYPWRYLWGVVS